MNIQLGLSTLFCETQQDKFLEGDDEVYYITAASSPNGAVTSNVWPGMTTYLNCSDDASTNKKDQWWSGVTDGLHTFYEGDLAQGEVALVVFDLMEDDALSDASRVSQRTAIREQLVDFVNGPDANGLRAKVALSPIFAATSALVISPDDVAKWIPLVAKLASGLSGFLASDDDHIGSFVIVLKNVAGQLRWNYFLGNNTTAERVDDTFLEIYPADGGAKYRTYMRIITS